MANLLIALAIALAGFVSGWSANGWRMGVQVEALKAKHQKSVADAAQESNRRLISMTNDRDAKAERLAAVDKTYTDQLTKARHENQVLSDRLAAGTVGLRIAATCAARTTGIAQGSQSGSVDSGAGAVLDPIARSTYSALRANIIATETTLKACQQALAEFQD